MTYIVQDVWRKILGKTDLLTCLNYSDIEAAEPFLIDPQAAMDIAIAANHRTGIRLLLRHGIGILSADTAARHGHLDLLKWICHREDVLDLNYQTFQTTAANGHLHVLQWIFETFAWECCRFTEKWLMSGYKSFSRAVKNGHLDVAKWLLSIKHQKPLHQTSLDSDDWTKWRLLPMDSQTESEWPNYIETVVLNSCKHPDVFRWLITEAQLELDLDMLGPVGVTAALRHGSLEELEWMQTQYPSSFSAWSRTSWTQIGYIYYSAMSLAIEGGHLKCVTLICTYSTDEFVVDTLREYEQNFGFLTRLKWNCDNDKSLAMLQWLHDRLGHFSCPNAAASAASSGNVKLLQYLKDTGGECLEHDELLDNAAKSGHLRVIQWIQQQGLNYGTIEASAWAAAFGHLEVLKWLHTNRPDLFCPERMKEATSQSAAAGHLDILKWIHQVRAADFSANAMDKAAEYGKLDVVKWLHEHRHEGATTHAMDSALKWRHYDIAIWLQAHRSEGCSSDVLEGCFQATSLFDSMMPYDTYDFLKQHYPDKLKAQIQYQHRFYGICSLEKWLIHSEQQFQDIHACTNPD